MENLVFKNNQVFSRFTNVVNCKIYCLVTVLCLFGCFTLKAHSQSNQKSNSQTGSTAQTGTQSQNKIGKVIVKEDEFANKKTTILTEHSLSPMLTVTMKCVIDRKANRSAMERYLDFATVEFASASGKREYGYGSEINFLVDGKSVKGNQVNSSLSRRQSRVENVITTLGFDVLVKISQGREVKMKMGENIFVLDNDFKKLVKEFVDSAQ
jgi:hypothetical protein